MLVLLGVLFLLVPIAELYVIVQVAQGIGVLNTIGLLLLVSAAGAWLCKREGLAVLGRVRASLNRYELPSRELADGALILFAGALMLSPGFVTDCFAVLLLLPPTRAVFRGALLRALQRRSQLLVVRQVRRG